MLEQKMLDFALLGAGWVLWLLVGLSVLCVGLAAERAIYLALNTAPAARFEAALGTFLGGGPRDALERELGAMRGIEPRVLLAGLSAHEGAHVVAKAPVPLLPALADEVPDLHQAGGVPGLGDELGAGEHGV